MRRWLSVRSFFFFYLTGKINLWCRDIQHAQGRSHPGRHQRPNILIRSTTDKVPHLLQSPSWFSLIVGHCVLSTSPHRSKHSQPALDFPQAFSQKPKKSASNMESNISEDSQKTAPDSSNGVNHFSTRFVPLPPPHIT